MSCNDLDNRWDEKSRRTIPFWWKTHLRKYGVPFFGTRNSKALLGLAYFASLQVGWNIDDWIFPSWKDQRVDDPVFILGHQRSGTTFVHRLLSLDTANFRPLKLHEMLFPSICFQVVADEMRSVDTKYGKPMATRIDLWQEQVLGRLDAIHRIRIDEIEEDEFSLWAIGASGMCSTSSPETTTDGSLDYLHKFETWSASEQENALAWYKSVLKKMKFLEYLRNGVSRKAMPLGKNPAFGQKVRWLSEAFPNARFVHLVRNPLEAIPSRLSLIREIWRTQFAGFREMTSEQIGKIVDDSIRTYLFAEKDLRELPDDRKLVISYAQLRESPRDFVEQIYRHFDIGRPAALISERLTDVENERTNARPAGHRYGLDEFGLKKDELKRALGPIFAEHEFHEV